VRGAAALAAIDEEIMTSSALNRSRFAAWFVAAAACAVIADLSCSSRSSSTAGSPEGAADAAVSAQAPPVVGILQRWAKRGPARSVTAAPQEFVLGPSEVEAAAARGAYFEHRLVPSARPVAHAAAVQMPTSAREPFVLADRDSGLEIAVRRMGAVAAQGEFADGYFVYRGAEGGADVVHRITAEGTEDFVLFEARPAEPRVRYEVRLGKKVAGLRLVSNVLEFLDSEGAPRLRVARPWAADARGHRHDAALALTGCAFDADPRAPWGRAVTPTAERTCVVEVHFQADLDAPFVLDPSWTSTGVMAGDHSEGLAHSLATLGAGRALIAGGYYSSRTAEIYDRSTNTWAITGSMKDDRAYAEGIRLNTGEVLVAYGNYNNVLQLTAEKYNPSTGVWTLTGSPSVGRYFFPFELLADGRAMAAGGQTLSSSGSAVASTEIYNPSTGTWSSTGNLNIGRRYHGLVRLASGKMLVMGGRDAGLAYLGSTEEWDPATGVWTGAGSLIKPRQWPTPTVLGSGSVLIGGGGSPSEESTAELYNPSTRTWATTGNLVQRRTTHTAILLADGRVLLAGGTYINTLSHAEIYNPATGTFAATAAMRVARYAPSSVLLSTGEVLVTSGTTAELYTAGASGPGGQCGVAAECPSGYVCTQGMCCTTACTGQCVTCSANPGICTTVTNSDTPFCSGNNTCDAAGACKLKNGQTCSDGTTCASGFCADGRCCNSACSAVCDVCSLALGASANGTCSTAPATYVGNPACGAYLCSGTNTACRTTCTSDTHCAAGYYCNASGACVARKANSAACNLAAGADCKEASCRACTSGFCVDGVCCNSPCADACDVCTAALGATADGTCGPASAGYPGSPACGTYACTGSSALCSGTSCTGDAACAADNYCAQNGSCQPRRAQAAQCNANAGADCLVAGCRVCQSGFCADGYCCASACDKPCDVCSTTPGQCTLAAAGAAGQPSCTPYRCTGASADCATSCATDADCVAGSFCNAGQCAALLAGGAPCTAASQCASTYCVDGVCCSTSCTGTCQACSNALKSAGPDGTCGDAKVDTDPHYDCAADDPTTCGQSGECDGGGQCKLYPLGATCAPASCAASVLSTHSCDGFGGCVSTVTADCGLYACNAGTASCPTSCTTSADCAAGAMCENGACIAKLPQGSDCTSSDQCLSGHCADGLCCSDACTGQCEACDVTGARGQCVPVSGAPHGDRTACDSGTDVCSGRRCDGVDRTACSAFASAATECRVASCVDGVAVLSANCDGKGACPAEQSKVCEPYACDVDNCKSACETDSDCAPKFRCDVGPEGTKDCIARIDAPVCNNYVVTYPDGGTQDCFPFTCEASGTCRTTCTATDQCVTGYVCVGTECVASGGSAAAPPDEGGCGCRMAGSRERGLPAILLGTLLACARRRRPDRAKCGHAEMRIPR
jgi:hypothetical protein